jgi:hypothetical protein
MQEAGSKLSRDHAKASYRAFRKVCLMVIELIRQFYDAPRCFRITGEGGTRFVSYDNGALLPEQSTVDGRELLRLPVFDIEVTAQKQNPYTRLSQNELALQFYSAGLFDPLRRDQALACLEMMDFDRKDFVVAAIQKAVPMGSPMPGTKPALHQDPITKARQNYAENIIPR